MAVLIGLMVSVYGEMIEKVMSYALFLVLFKQQWNF